MIYAKLILTIRNIYTWLKTLVLETSIPGLKAFVGYIFTFLETLQLDSSMDTVETIELDTTIVGYQQQTLLLGYINTWLEPSSWLYIHMYTWQEMLRLDTSIHGSKSWNWLVKLIPGWKPYRCKQLYLAGNPIVGYIYT